MRYFCSTMWRGYPKKPLPWKTVNVTDEVKIIEADYHNNHCPNDFDNCGDETIYYAFSTGKFYKLEHSWWRNDFDREDDNDSGMRWEHTIEQVDEHECEGLIQDRDWLPI